MKLCVSSKWLQADDYLLRILQYTVVCLASASVGAAVTWLTAALLNAGSEGLCALHSAAHRRNGQDNNLSKLWILKVRGMLFTTFVICPD